jgi:hypothetical protein
MQPQRDRQMSGSFAPLRLFVTSMLVFSPVMLMACGQGLTDQGCNSTYGGTMYDFSLTATSASATSMTLIGQALKDTYHVGVDSTDQDVCGVPQLLQSDDITASGFSLSVEVTDLALCGKFYCGDAPISTQTVPSGTPFSVSKTADDTLQIEMTCADASDPLCHHGHPDEFGPQSAFYCVDPGSQVLRAAQYSSCFD